MEPFAAPDQLDSKLREFLEEACNKLCNWYAETDLLAPLPTSVNLPTIPPSIEGLSNEALFEDLQILMDGAYRPSHPGALAHLDPPPLSSSIVADLICAGLNNNLLAYELSPSFSKLEQSLCKWFVDRLGMPPEAGGVVASGGTISNLMALVVARNQSGLQNDPDAVVLTSSDSHCSLVKAIRVMGMTDEALHKVSTDDNGQIILELLIEDLKKLRAKGKKCFAIVATAGTTVRGAIDPLSELSELCLVENLWLHVDAAIGGVFALNKTTSSLVKGISLANSISLNPQKLIGVAKTSSLLFVSNRKFLLSTFGTSMPYLEPISEETTNGGELGLQGTRSAEILKLWLGLRHLGEKGIQNLLEQAISRRGYLQDSLDSSKLKLISGPLHLLAFTPKNIDANLSSNWSVNTRKKLLNNKFMLSRPFYNRRYYLKAVLGNPNTKVNHLDELSVLINSSID